MIFSPQPYSTSERFFFDVLPSTTHQKNRRKKDQYLFEMFSTCLQTTKTIPASSQSLKIIKNKPARLVKNFDSIVDIKPVMTSFFQEMTSTSQALGITNLCHINNDLHKIQQETFTCRSFITRDQFIIHQPTPPILRPPMENLNPIEQTVNFQFHLVSSSLIKTTKKTIDLVFIFFVSCAAIQCPELKIFANVVVLTYVGWTYQELLLEKFVQISNLGNELFLTLKSKF